MSKKKKNIRRKKSNNLLKGVAAAGAVVGGGTIFAGNNAVYAAENEQDAILTKEKQEELLEKQSVSESTTESLSNSTSNQGNFNLGQSIFKSAAEPEVAMVADTEEDTSETTIDGTQYANEDPVEEDASDTTGDTTTFEGNTTTETGQQDESNSPSNNNEDDESVSASQSVSDFIKYSEAVKAESLNIAVSKSLSNSLASNSTTLNDPLSNIGSDSYASNLKEEMDRYNSEYESLKESYDKQISNSNYVGVLYNQIRIQNEVVNNEYDKWHKNFFDPFKESDFYREVDKLVELYAQYYLYQTENKQIHIKNNPTWLYNNGDHNYVRLDYYDANSNEENNNIQSAYFDYFITNKNDQRIDQQLLWQKRYKFSDISIMVLKKSPVYASTNLSDNQNHKFYFSDQYPNNKLERTFYINDKKLQKAKNRIQKII